eukprot:TRINITY_DN21891_c0_g1_i1.p1 TRINITY_DN21891_c0_g1~~TRINITY_DN21891_c0_g1_i1.p1  ORF type:complete len:208 (-),score=3.93 TRINITY_DN21891_c0_g1_i1:76-606(-)
MGLSNFRGWVCYGSVVPRFFSCFYPVGGFTLWPFICLRETREELEEAMGAMAIAEFINHEQIHIAQATEMCCIGMYLLWVYDFFKGLICMDGYGPKLCGCGCDPAQSYVWNRLEQEAFDHQDDQSYLGRRPWFGWRFYPMREVAVRWSACQKHRAQAVLPDEDGAYVPGDDADNHI